MLSRPVKAMTPAPRANRTRQVSLILKIARISRITAGSSAVGPPRSLPHEGDASTMTAAIPMVPTAVAA
jgi:hypothetical protein